MLKFKNLSKKFGIFANFCYFVSSLRKINDNRAIDIDHLHSIPYHVSMSIYYHRVAKNTNKDSKNSHHRLNYLLPRDFRQYYGLLMNLPSFNTLNTMFNFIIW